MFISCLIVTACSEEDSPLMFSVESISNPENVRMEYYSPDPCCISKMYWIIPLLLPFKDLIDESYLEYRKLNVVSQTKNGTVRTGITVKRWIPNQFIEF